MDQGCSGPGSTRLYAHTVMHVSMGTTAGQREKSASHSVFSAGAARTIIIYRPVHQLTVVT